MGDRIRAAWATGGPPPLGSFVFSRASSNVEILGRAGFDFAVLDMEHAPLGLAEIESHVRAADVAGIDALVRVPEADPSVIGRVLDLGATGVLAPHFGRDRASARRFAATLRYAPTGQRPSCTGVRAAGYALDVFADYVRHSDQAVIGIGMIEDAAVLGDLDALLADAPVDALMPGPSDLATGFGLPGQPTHPTVREAVGAIRDAARRAGLRVGMYLNAPDEVAEWPGLDFYVYLMDVKVLGLAYVEAARAIRTGIKAEGSA